MSRPEILAPAGNQEMVRAAFAAGCDAIYVGAKRFGARAYSENFEVDELIALIAEAHRRGVRVFLTANTLIMEQEMDDVLALLHPLADAGLDAVILQDLGLMARLKREIPNLERHASTQMSVTSLDGALALQGLGYTRVVLGRETSIEEAERIVQQTDLEVEVFAHGSLCMSVSGQCYLSAFSGGRSGNRGACAQPCRKTYTLQRPNGQILGAENTYLSPRDLMTLDRIAEFSRIGVHSLKIEGRMKKPEYVFAAVSAYRKALLKQPYDAKGLQRMTNRPFTEGLMFHAFGTDMAFDRKQSGGECIGTIDVQDDGQRYVFTKESLVAGDMLMLQGKRGTFPYTVSEDYPAGSKLLFPMRDIPRNSSVLLVYTETVRRKLQEALAEERKKDERLPLTLSVSIAPEKPLHVIARSGREEIVWEGAVVSPARSHALDRDTVERAFRKVGNTAFMLEKLTVSLEDGAFVPVSQLNAARRDALNTLSHALSRSTLRERPTTANGTPASAFYSKENSQRVEEHTSVLGAYPSQEKPRATKIPRILLETDRDPDAFSGVLENVDRVLFSDLTHARAWREAGIPVDWAFPLLQESDAVLCCWEEARALSHPFDGITVRTFNELGHVLREMENLPHPISIALGFGFNLRNSDAFSEVSRWAREIPIVRTAISVECTKEEAFSFPSSALEAEMLYFGPAPGMLLRQCPCALLKGCHDEQHCKTCTFRQDVLLVDSYGKRPMVRRKGYTELLSPTRIDLRKDTTLLSRIKPSWLRIVDVGQETYEVLKTVRRSHAGERIKNAGIR